MDQIVLRSPELGDSVTINTNAEIKRTLAGQLCISADWTNDKILSLSFKAITTADMLAFQTLLIANQGKEIQLTDPDGVLQTGIIITPVIEFKQFDETCWWDFSFQFEVTE
jgi:hypothetical protein